jgi:hypothetical protein
MAVFTCKGCGTKYTVIKRAVPPDEVQQCELCALVFPAKEALAWLRYYRVDPPAGPDAA